MAGLMDKTEQRKAGLQRAGDADTDPASISDSENTSTSASTQASVRDAGIANAKNGDLESDQARDTSSESTGQIDSATAGGTAGKDASATGSRKGSGKTRESSGRKAGASASGKASNRKPRRGVGRPAGPERQAITVRVLAEHDAKLTQAWDQEGMRPQQVIDAALGEWFERHLEKERTARG